MWSGRAGLEKLETSPAVSLLSQGLVARVGSCEQDGRSLEQGGRSPKEAVEGWWMRGIYTGFKIGRKS